MTKSKKTKVQDKQKPPILVIDGRPVRKFYTSIFLQRCNYLVITADNAEDGLRYMNVTKPLVVIANIDLPDMNGAELLRRVKKSSKTRSVPVIIYTSNKDLQIQQECEQAGCSAYLRHPASLEDLYAAIQKATNKPRRFVRLETLLDVTVGDGHGVVEPAETLYCGPVRARHVRFHGQPLQLRQCSSLHVPLAERAGLADQDRRPDRIPSAKRRTASRPASA